MLQFKGDKLIGFSHTLSKLHKSALPNAVRFSLNDAAKDVKFNTLQKNADKQFDVKKPSFFRAFSRFDLATGYNIGSMKATAGMVKAPNPKSVASTKIAQQQIAGTVTDRAYIGAKEQRKGGTESGLLKASYKKLTDIKPIVTTKDNYFGKAVKAKKENKPLLVKKNNKGILVKIKKIKKKGENPIITEPIASYEKGRSIKLKKKRPFLNNAALQSGKKIDSFFIKNATKQIQRFK